MSQLKSQRKTRGTDPLPGDDTHGRATASLFLGLFSLVLVFCPLVGVAASIGGLVLGLQGRHRGEGGIATAGVILSTLGLLLNVVWRVYLGTTGQEALVEAVPA